VISLIFLSVVLSQVHFTEIPNSSGISQMVIIENIIGLEIGDEVGLFDSNGLINSYDCSDQYGELLVGAGIYLGNQLEIVSTGSIDYCDFDDGYQLSGYLNNHTISIKVWDASHDIEYIPSFEFSQGNGNWGDFFSVIDLLTVNELSLNDSNEFSIYSLYPNPFNSYLNIYIPELNNQDNTINIYDIYGNNIDNISNYNNNNLLVWNASNFESGIYFFSFKYNNKLISKKVTLLK
jgi:hypothetical protein